MGDLDSWMERIDFDFFSRGKHKIKAEKFLEKMEKGEALLLDVRAPEELEYIDFPFALKIPFNEVPKRKNEVPRDKTVAVFCSAGTRSAIAYAYLASLGWENVVWLQGGYDELVAKLKPGKIRKTREKASRD